MSDLIQAAKDTIAGKPGALRQKAKSLEAIATERYEYAVQVKIGAKWLFLGRGAGGHSFAKNAFWFEKKEKAQGHQLIREETAPTRIVRRRVSTPEVINERKSTRLNSSHVSI